MNSKALINKLLQNPNVPSYKIRVLIDQLKEQITRINQGFNINYSFFNIMFNLSQEEIDQLVKEIMESPGVIKDEQMDFFKDTIPNDYKLTTNSCQHKWKSYQGLNESFDYCTICDVKK